MLDALYNFLLLPALIQFASSTGIAFQGSCADRSVLCEQLCVALSSDTYECWCWDGHKLLGDGIGCVANDSRIDVHFSDVLNSHSTTSPLLLRPARFTGQKFVQFPAPENAYLETNITIEFRVAENEEGILLYAGEYEGNDFISLAFSGRDIVLRFDCGEGTVEETYTGPFQKDTWHRLIVKRKFCEHSELSVDNGNVLTDEIRELDNYKGVTIETGICIGGAPARVRNLDGRVSTAKGFRGCVRHLTVNNVTLYDVNSGINGAVTPIQFCNENAMAMREDVVSTDEVSIITSTTTAPLTSTVLPLTEYAADFDEVSYVQVRAPKDNGNYLELTFLVKVRQPNGLVYLLHSNRYYFAVYFENAFLMVHYSLANGYEILSSQHPLSLKTWHRVEIWRTGKAALLKIDDQQWIESHMSETVTAADIENYDFAYIGGAPTAEIPHNLPTRSGFSGCLKKVYQNNRFVDLVHDALATRKVHQCGWDVCGSTHCQENAQCIAYRAEPYCRCRFPTFGATCEKRYTSPIMELRFERFSYLKLSDHHIMKHITGETLDLSFTILIRNVTNDFSPHAPDQILAYTGDSESVGDYLHLLLSGNNELKLIVNLGSGPVALTHPTILEPDGVWHNITVTRNGRHITLSVDELSISSMSPGPSIELNVYDSLYIGGLPKSEPSLLGFTGCIGKIRIGFENVESPANTTEAVNITECF